MCYSSSTLAPGAPINPRCPFWPFIPADPFDKQEIIITVYTIFYKCFLLFFFSKLTKAYIIALLSLDSLSTIRSLWTHGTLTGKMNITLPSFLPDQHHLHLCQGLHSFQVVHCYLEGLEPQEVPTVTALIGSHYNYIKFLTHRFSNTARGAICAIRPSWSWHPTVPFRTLYIGPNGRDWSNW